MIGVPHVASLQCVRKRTVLVEKLILEPYIEVQRGKSLSIRKEAIHKTGRVTLPPTTRIGTECEHKESLRRRWPVLEDLGHRTREAVFTHTWTGSDREWGDHS